MTNDLAKLLDGPVAERFGPPIYDTIPMRMEVVNGAVQWYSGDIWLTDFADALWLAHLIGVCGKNVWAVEFYPARPGWVVDLHKITGPVEECGTENCIASEWCNDSLLSALAHAMLAVPENKP